MPIAVRALRQGDDEQARALLDQLGYPVDAAEFARRLAGIAGHDVLVAAEGDICHGLMVLHEAPMLQLARPGLRIMTLVVDAAARGKGVGRLLTDHALELARRRGCELVELTTSLHRTGAHAFYQAAGFSSSSLRFARKL